MAEISKAKFERLNAKKDFNRSNKALSAAITASVEEELVRSRYTDTKESLKTVTKLHNDYNWKLYGDGDEPDDADSFIDELDAAFRESEHQAFKYFQSFRTKDEDVKLPSDSIKLDINKEMSTSSVHRLKNIRYLEADALTTQIAEIEKSIIAKGTLSVIHELPGELKMQWQRIKDAHRELVIPKEIEIRR